MAYTYRASTSAGNNSGGALSINKPTGTADGDLLVAVWYLESDTNTFSSVPSGWSLAGSIANTGAFKIWVYWKKAASEGASWSWTPSSSAWRAAVCAAYSGGTNPAVDVAGTGGQGDAQTYGNQSAPSVTTVSDNALVIWGYGNYNGDNVPGMAGFCTNLRVSFGGCTIADATKTPAGSTGTSNPNSSIGSEDYAAIHIAFAIGTAGGTTYTLGVGGSLTSSGALAKFIAKELTAVLTGSGTPMKQARHILVGVLTASGVMSGIKTALTNVSGALTFTGTLQKQIQYHLTAVWSGSGGVQKQTAKIFNGVLTGSGVLTSIKAALLSIGGILSVSGTLRQQTNKILSGALSAWGILRKQVNKGLSGVFNASVVLSASRLARLTLSGSVTSSGALRKQVAIYHAGVLSTAGGIRKAVQTALSGVLSSIGQLLASVVGTSVIMDGFDVRETRASIILDSSPAWPMLYETRQNPLYYETRENLMLDTIPAWPVLEGEA